LYERFDAYELRRLELAEQECPWGEMSQNYRMMYLSATIQACLSGHKESAAEANNQAQRLWLKLFGPQPSPPPVRVADLPLG